MGAFGAIVAATVTADGLDTATGDVSTGASLSAASAVTTAVTGDFGGSVDATLAADTDETAGPVSSALALSAASTVTAATIGACGESGEVTVAGKPAETVGTETAGANATAFTLSAAPACATVASGALGGSGDGTVATMSVAAISEDARSGDTTGDVSTAGTLSAADAWATTATEESLGKIAGKVIAGSSGFGTGAASTRLTLSKAAAASATGCVGLITAVAGSASSFGATSGPVGVFVVLDCCASDEVVAAASLRSAVSAAWNVTVCALLGFAEAVAAVGEGDCATADVSTTGVRTIAADDALTETAGAAGTAATTASCLATETTRGGATTGRFVGAGTAAAMATLSDAADV